MLTLFNNCVSRLLVITACILPALSWADTNERWGTNMTEGVTPVSREIYSLHMDIFWWCVGIGVVVFGVMFFC